MLAKRLLKEGRTTKTTANPKKYLESLFMGVMIDFLWHRWGITKDLFVLCSGKDRLGIVSLSLFFCFTSYVSGTRSKCPCKTRIVSYKLNLHLNCGLQSHKVWFTRYNSGCRFTVNIVHARSLYSVKRPLGRRHITVINIHTFQVDGFCQQS